MSETSNNESVHTPQDTSSGEGQEEKVYFKYSASLRIFGTIPDLDEITQSLGVIPSGAYRKGDRGWGENLPPYKLDMCMYSAPVKETEPLHLHIDALWNTFRDRKEYLLHLKQKLTVGCVLRLSEQLRSRGGRSALSKLGNVQGIADIVRAFNHCGLAVLLTVRAMTSN